MRFVQRGCCPFTATHSGLIDLERRRSRTLQQEMFGIHVRSAQARCVTVAAVFAAVTSEEATLSGEEGREARVMELTEVHCA